MEVRAGVAAGRELPIVLAAGAVDAGAGELSEETLASLDFAREGFLVEDASGAAADGEGVEVASAFLLLDDFAFDVSDAAVEVSEAVALDFVDFFDFLVEVVDD